MNCAIIFVILCAFSFAISHSHQQNFSLLRDFTCAVVEDELKEHPEMQTVALIELENNLPSNFS